MRFFVPLLIGSLFFTGSAFADCAALGGQLDVSWVSESCDSPVGLCTAGRIKGSSLLRGATTRYVVRAAGPTPDDAQAETAMSYVGRLVITSPRGTVTVEDLGVFDKGTGLIVSQSRGLSGTGAFEGVTGAVFTYGQATASGFRSRLGGKLCFTR